MKNVGFVETAFSHGRRSSFVSLISSQSNWLNDMLSVFSPRDLFMELPRSFLGHGPFKSCQEFQDGAGLMV